MEGGQRSEKNRRIPDVPSDLDINSFIPKLWERFADTEAIEYLCKEVFRTGKYPCSASPDGSGRSDTVRPHEREVSLAVVEA